MSAVMCSKYGCDVGDGSLSVPYFHQRAYDSAYHAMQEAVCANDEIIHSFSPRYAGPGCIFNRANSVFRFGLCSAKRIEVMLTEQQGGRFVHLVDIRCGSQIPSNGFIDGKGNGAQTIPVLSGLRIKSSVKGIMNRSQGPHGNGARKKPPEGAEYTTGIEFSFNDNVGDLATGVHTRICSARPHHVDVLA